MNAWVYGISMLMILLLPMLVYLVELALMTTFTFDGSGGFLQNYLALMLFPYPLSSEFLFQIPYLGVILAIASFALHLHFYSVLIERLFTITKDWILNNTSKSRIKAKID